MVVKKNAWLVHMAKCRKAHPELKRDFKKLAALAKKSYVKK